MTKRILALVLAVVMVVALFAGCNNNNSASTTAAAASTTKAAASTTKAAATTAAAASTTAAAAEESNLNDLGVLPLVKESQTLTAAVRKANYVDLSTNTMWNHVQEQTGVTIEAMEIEGSEFATKLDLMMAAGGDDLPDLILGDAVAADVYNEWGKAGFLMDILEYTDGNMFWGDQIWSQEGYTFADMVEIATKATEGKMYFFPNRMTGGEVPSASSINGRIYWYMPWIEKSGLSYDENGEFMTTLDQMYDHLIKVRDNDYNGNGIQDEIPLTGYQKWYLQCGIVSHFTGNDGQGTFFVNPATGKIEINYATEDYRAALTFINKLVDEKLLDPLAFSQDQASMWATIISDEIRVGGYVDRNKGQSTLDTVPSSADFDYSNHLQAPGKDFRSSYGLTFAAVGGTYFLTQNCSDPALAIRLADWCTNLALEQGYGFPGHEIEFYNDLANKENFINLYGKNLEDCYYVYTKEDAPDKRKWDDAGNNVTFVWHFPYAIKSTSNHYLLTDKTKVTDQDLMVGKRELYYTQGMHKMYQNELVPTLVYTEDERQQYTDLYTPIGTYIGECFTRFCLGDMDIDTEWDAYLAEIEAMGAADLLELMNDVMARG